MARLGADLHVIERCLNHVSGSFGGIVGVYQKHRYEDNMRRALEGWARYITAIVDGGDVWLRHLRELNNESARERFNAAIVAGGDAWARYLDTIVSGSSASSNVVDIATARA